MDNKEEPVLLQITKSRLTEQKDSKKWVDHPAFKYHRVSTEIEVKYSRNSLITMPCQFPPNISFKVALAFSFWPQQ